MTDDDRKTERRYRETLTDEQYRVTRQAATEPPFTGKYWDCKDPGTYHCVCCGTDLFGSETKYDSGSGWPSFFEAIDPEKITVREDLSHGMRRLEVLCARCDAHLGHLFDDGPAPTGKRYCINSAALDLKGNDR